MKNVPTNNNWSNTIIDRVIATGAHEDLNISDKDFINSIQTLMVKAGLVSGINVNIGYGCSKREDVILNIKSIIEIFEKQMVERKKVSEETINITVEHSSEDLDFVDYLL